MDGKERPKKNQRSTLRVYHKITKFGNVILTKSKEKKMENNNILVEKIVDMFQGTIIDKKTMDIITGSHSRRFNEKNARARGINVQKFRVPDTKAS